VFQKENRRVSTGDQSSISFEELRETAHRLFGNKLPAEILLKYKDEEGDLITCSSDEELQTAFLLSAETKILKFYIYPSESKNILDILEDALGKFLKDNPATALWELIKEKSEKGKLKKKEAQEEIEKSVDDCETIDPLLGTSQASAPISTEDETEVREKVVSNNEEISRNEEENLEARAGQNEERQQDSQQNTEEGSVIASDDDELSEESEEDYEESLAQPSTVSSVSMSTDTVALELQKDAEIFDSFSSCEGSVSSKVDSVLCSRISSKLEQLHDMGFNNREKNIEYLLKHNGDLLEAVKSLLENM